MNREQTEEYEWRRLYLAALFERDRKQLLKRIVQARTAIVRRGHELIQSPGDTYEMRALDSALDALQALRNVHESQSRGEDIGEPL